MGSVNYIRNAVKATVDAYDGETHLYIFAPDDPIIGAYRQSVSRICSCRHRRCPPICGGTRAIRRRCSASRPRSTARTTCSIRSRSITRRTCGTWRSTPDQEQRLGAGYAHLRDGHAAGRGQARVPADAALYAAQQEQPDRPDGGALRRRSPGRNRGAAALQAAVDSRTDEHRGLHQSGPEHFQGPDAVEPAGLARAARADSGAAGGQHVPVCGSDLHIRPARGACRS